MMSWPTSRFESEQKQSIRRNSGRRSFVRQITSTPSDTAIVGAIISMGQSMNLRVIAEAVETQEGWQFYGRIGVMKRKGTYFSRPVRAQQFARLLETGIQRASAATSYSTSEQNYPPHSKMILDWRNPHFRRSN